jgi:hypothetical protein
MTVPAYFNEERGSIKTIQSIFTLILQQLTNFGNDSHIALDGSSITDIWCINDSDGVSNRKFGLRREWICVRFTFDSERLHSDLTNLKQFIPFQTLLKGNDLRFNQKWARNYRHQLDKRMLYTV